ncbi:MAG: DEAD/DEAH box helicase [Muribaculaceae bacterium]|nr:DEAD/DEAH box helicase [Muribaculaceae bacterium]
MNLSSIHEKIFHRLGIRELNAMQLATSEFSLPGKLMLLAPTGSGKTVAFTIPLLRSLGAPDGKVQAVVMAPSRELVLQIAEIVRGVAGKEYKTVAFYGGHAMSEEQRSIEGGMPDIIIATPGRLLDHLRRGELSVHDVHTLVLDEFDKSLELGFREEMSRVVGRMRSLKTLILTSATRIAEMPDFVDVKGLRELDFTGGHGSAAPAPHLRVHSVASDKKDKLEGLDALLRYIAEEDSEAGRKTKAMVFVNHRESAERVSAFLDKQGYRTALYHGGLDQNEREKAVAMFTNGSAPVLVATDLAARGLDIDSVGAVVHYHLPLQPETWTHRNGRTGRMGAEGDVYVLLSPEEATPEFIDEDLTDAIELPPTPGAIPAAPMQTLHINAGKKEKISKGDIAGFFMKQGGLTPGELGMIDLKDHQAYVAVPQGRAREIIAALAPHKLKNTRVRITQVK